MGEDSESSRQSLAEEFGKFGFDGGGFAEGLAYEDGVDAYGFKFLNVGTGFDAAFCDEFGFIVDEVGQADGGFDVDLHGGEVTVVDAYEAVSFFGETDEASHCEEGIGFVYLDEDGEGEFGGGYHQIHHLGGVHGLGDEEYGVGAGGTGFVNLPEVNYEIFAEDGQVDGVFDLLDIFEASLEIFLVGEDADGVGAALLVDFSDLDGVKILADDARGWGGFFDFGDDVYAAGVAFGDGLVEIAALGQRADVLLELFEASLGLAQFDFEPFVGDNLV